LFIIDQGSNVFDLLIRPYCPVVALLRSNATLIVDNLVLARFFIPKSQALVFGNMRAFLFVVSPEESGMIQSYLPVRSHLNHNHHGSIPSSSQTLSIAS
jgi:hypothetical protein